MDIDILHLIEGAKQARGLTVIIDVFRAFSTACYVVKSGARGIIPEKVSLVCMGTWAVEPNDEDSLCAQYIADRLNNQKIDTKKITTRLKESKTARIFFDPEVKWAPEKDFELCLSIGLCGFILKAEKIPNDLLILKPEYS